MLAVASVVVEKCVSICFLTFYILQARSPKRRGARGNRSGLLSLSMFWYINNALINTLKKLTQCVR